MRMSAKTRTVAAFCGVLLLLLATLGCLRLIQAGRDNALFTTVHARPLLGDEPDPAAAEIELVAALWEKALYYDGTQYEYTQQGRVPQTSLRLRGNALRALGEAGVFPKEASVAEAGHMTGFAEVYKRTERFAQLYDVLLYDMELAVSAYLMLPKGGAAGFDLEGACQSYVDYLGLDALTDWQPASLADVQGQYTAGLYSPGAQILLQVTRDTRLAGGESLSCSMHAMARSVFDEQQRSEG